MVVISSIVLGIMDRIWDRSSCSATKGKNAYFKGSFFHPPTHGTHIPANLFLTELIEFWSTEDSWQPWLRPLKGIRDIPERESNILGKRD